MNSFRIPFYISKTITLAGSHLHTALIFIVQRRRKTITIISLANWVWYIFFTAKKKKTIFFYPPSNIVNENFN